MPYILTEKGRRIVIKHYEIEAADAAGNLSHGDYITRMVNLDRECGCSAYHLVIAFQRLRRFPYSTLKIPGYRSVKAKELLNKGLIKRGKVTR